MLDKTYFICHTIIAKGEIFIKKLLKTAIIAIMILSVLLSPACNRQSVTELGIPSKDNYSKESGGLYAMDLRLYENKLYVGDGDYGANTGPVKLMAYNLKTKKWETSGTLPDEAIRRFIILNGKLTVPGTDPRDDWSFGNYYVLENGAWSTVRTIPDGIHNFDMIEFDGKIFAALDKEPEKIPLAASIDGGRTFYTVEMLKDGELIDTDGGVFNRCLEFIVHNDTLYTTYFYSNEANDNIRFELYRYSPTIGKFEFVKSLIGVTPVRSDCGKEFFKSTATFKNKVFIASGYLLVSSDMDTFDKIKFEKNDVVWDIELCGDEMYVLTSYKNKNGTHTVSVWKNTDGNPDNLSLEFRFTYDIPAVSFAVSNDDFFFSMYNNRSVHDKNGIILRYAR